VLSQLPDSTFTVIGKERQPIRDVHGLILTPEMSIADAPLFDVLLVPGGAGQEALMEDEAVLEFIRKQADQAKLVFAVCTGVLVCGAAGLLIGKRVTTYWSTFDLIPYFGAIPVDERVVIDGKFVTAAGVTSGIDGALTVAAILRGDQVAQEIQLSTQYAPEPPFNSGDPKTAPPAVLEACTRRISELKARRLSTAKSVAAKLGIAIG
ncbi:MAG TPA: DJ-1/PfpI family protein, partial [Pirellulales bacterium]|jgi:cyclohexyl-isocyanide hydratase